VLRKAVVEDLNSINRVIELCLANRPVSDRIKKITLPLLLYEPIDFNYMTVCVTGEPVIGVMGLQKIDEGMLLHSIYVDPYKSNKGVGSELFRQAYQLAKMNNQSRLIVKAFFESRDFFKKLGFTPSDILDYPHTLEMAV
jgi:N-acetylglutamate synthase-like GNAT family acetyltransferase